MAEQDENSGSGTPTPNTPQGQRTQPPQGTPARRTPAQVPPVQTPPTDNNHDDAEGADDLEYRAAPMDSDNFQNLEEVTGGKVARYENDIFVQPTGNKYWYYYHAENDTWYEGDSDHPGMEILFLSKKKRNLLTGLHLQKAKTENLLDTNESKRLIEYVKTSGGWSPAAKACGAILTIGVAAAAGALLYKEYGPEKTITNTVTKDNNIYHDNHFDTLLKEAKGNLTDVWTPAQIDAKWGTNTSANVTILEDMLAKDKVIDVLWGSYQTDLKAQGIATTKEAMYTMSFGQLAEASNNVGFEAGKVFVHSEALKRANEATKDITNLTKPYTGVSLANITALDELVAKDAVIEEIMKLDAKLNKESLYGKSFSELANKAYTIGLANGGNAQTAITAAHTAVMNTAKSALGDVYTINELNSTYGGATVQNISALEHLVTLDPQVDSAFADSYLADYFGHTGLAKKAAYTDKDLQTKVQSGVEYKYTAIDFENDRTASKLLNETGNAREAGLQALNDAAAYSWLTGNYNVNLSLPVIQEITNNDTYGNTSLGTALAGLWNNGADRASIYLTNDGLFVQGYANNTPVTSDVAKYGVKWGGAMDNNQKNFKLFEKFKG